jgi:anti-sigma regulatory factor (Ser/Thr protein kinase)
MTTSPKILIADSAQEQAAVSHARALFGDQARAPALMTGASGPSGSSWLFTDAVSEDTFSDALSLDIDGIVELGAAERLPKLPDTSGIVIALTTRTAYGLQVARLCTLALVAKAGRSEDERMDMELAIHEAYSNGLIHGNLELGSELRGSLENYDRYALQLEERLADDAYGGKYILLTGKIEDGFVTVQITDQGLGYDVGGLSDNEERKHGRGLAMIEAACHGLAVSDNGRTITMTFAVSEGDA